MFTTWLESELERARFDSGQSLSSEENQPSHEKSWLSVSDGEDDGPSEEKVEPSSIIQPDAPLVYHYLTFDTELPLPSAQTSVLPTGRPPPEPPDLSDTISPLEWSNARKSLITWLSCAATTVTAYTAGAYSSGIDQMMAEWHISEEAALVGITIFTCGFAVAPMVLAPFSEINGRKPVFVVTGILFVIFQLFCAVTRSFGGMLISRFLAGASSSTFSTMVGGVLADIYVAEERNMPMALFSGAALFGTGIGPLVSGFIAAHTTWRWIFYLQVITCGVLMVFLVVFFKETRGSILLSKRAKKLNRWYEEREQAGYYGFRMPVKETPTGFESQRIRWKVEADEERTSVAKMIGISVYRPFHLLFTEPVVFFFSLWVSFSWAILYMTFSAIPLVFETSYNFSLQDASAVFATNSIASVIFTVISIYQEHFAIRHGKLSAEPEGRLYFTCFESVLLPIGLFWFGWTSVPSVPWIVPALGLGCATMGIFSIYLATFNYLADTYHKYTSSAIAAQSFCRNMLGGAFPLITRQMFMRMGFGGAGSFLGGLGLLLTLVPWVLVFYGPRIRARSKFASEIMK